MSQLDCSVLDALPSSMRNQILRSYEKSIKNETQLSKLVEKEQEEIVRLLTSTDDPNVQKPVEIPSSNHAHVSDHCTREEIEAVCSTDSEVDHSPCVRQEQVAETKMVIDNEQEFLKEFRKYIREWVANSKECPTESDAITFTDFLASFAETNLEVTQVILRFFRRLVLQLDSRGWAFYFNTLLVKVQEVSRQCSGGTLKIAELQV